MKTLDEENLISGIIDAVENDETAAGDSMATDEAVPSEEPAPDHEAIIERVVDRTLDRLADRLKEAEERGFRKAVELARSNPDRLGIDRSVPNFLADVRRDVWD